MDSGVLRDKSLAEIVEQDYVRAYVLYYFGIRFYEYSGKSLEEVCHAHGLQVNQVIQQLESPVHPLSEKEVPLVSYPIDLILEYLKHAHFLFVKHKLPYISRLLEGLNEDETNATVARDLKTLFPLFVDDFIHHIYEEEDTLFRYISLLESAARGRYNPSKLYRILERYSLRKFAEEHEIHDDEMDGIRKITGDYFIAAGTPLHIRVVYSELIALEKSLIIHARIENEILFPKAMMLENQVNEMLRSRMKLN